MEENVHFAVAGTSHSRTILFLHGMGVTRSWWQPQMQALADEYRVIAPDLPGHGSRAAELFEVDPLLAELAALIDSQAGGGALVVGISLGGYLAMRLAGFYPGKALGLVLSGSSMSLHGLRGLGMRLSGLMLKFKGADWLEENQIRSFRKRIAPEFLEPVLEEGLFMDTAIRNFASVTGRNYARSLAAFPGPVLILNGEGNEPNRGPDEKLAARLPDARLEILEGAGHLCNLEQPDAYSLAVRRFADSLHWQPETRA